MSETLMNLSNPYVGERRAGTVGLPLPGVSIRLLGPGGKVSCRRGNRGGLSARTKRISRLLAS